MPKAKRDNILEQINIGVRSGVARALLEHKKAGRPIVVWRDGKIVWIPAEEIQVDEKLIQGK